MKNKIRQIIVKTVMCVGMSGALFMVQPAGEVHADEIVMQTDSASLENPMVVPGNAVKLRVTDSFSAGSAIARRAAANTHVVYNGSYGDELRQSGSENAYYLYQKLVEYYIGKDHSALREAKGDLNCTIENLKAFYSFPATTKQVADKKSGTTKTTLDTDTAAYREVSSLFKFDMQSAIDAFDYDYPEAFDLVANGYSWTIDADGDKNHGYTGYINSVEVKFVEAYSSAAADVSRWRSALVERAESIRSNPDVDLNGDGRLSDAELVKGIHDYLCERFYYDNTRLRNYTVTKNYQIFGAAAANLDDLPMGVVCEGYSRSMKAFCDYFHIPACLVAGSVSSSSMGHMWNAIQVDGRWYLTDLTWDDQTIGYRHDYLLKGNITSGRTANGRFSSTRASAFTFVYPEISTSDYHWPETSMKEENESETAASSEEAEEPQGQTEPEAVEEPPKQTEPEVIEEPPKQTELEVVEEPQKQTEPEVIEEPQKQTEPEAIEEPQKQTEPEAVEEPQKQTEPEVVEEPPKQTEPEAVEEPPKQTEAEAVKEPQGQTEQTPSKSQPAAWSTLRRPQITVFKAKCARKVLIRWTKDPAVDGYELQYAYKKKFTGAKTIRIAKGKTSRTLKKLKRKKTMYCRIRSYKIVNGQRQYSKWSPKRKVKVK